MATERSSKRRKLDSLADTSASLPGFATWNIEQDYERRPRKKDKKTDKRDRLLVKSQESGRWEQDTSRAEEQSEDGEDSSSPESDGEVDSAVADLRSKPAPKKPTVTPKEEIRLAKEELARAAGLLSESPEEHINSLNTLAELANSDNVTVKKLALGTQFAVYKDIVPGYRIRPLPKDEQQAKVSKDVKKLRSYEQSLLGGYRDYVNLLSRLASGKGSSDSTLISVAVSCACHLLKSVPHFNYRNDLIAILVQKLSNRTLDADYLTCATTLEQLFGEDEDGHASLEAVSQLTKMMKAKNYNIHERVLNTFLHLRLLSEFAHKASTSHIDKDGEPPNKAAKKAKQKKEFRTKRERKLLRERKEVAKEMKEADAAVSFEERDKNQAETLKLVFVAYFRILKVRTSHLMGAVLEGLAKYAHLINQDFFGDVLESLKDLIKDTSISQQDADTDEDELASERTRDTTRESLLCIITAFALLQGQRDVAKSANALHLDLNFFTTHLYQTLLPLSMEQDIEAGSQKAAEDPDDSAVSTTSTKVNVATTTVLLLRSLQAVLLPSTSTRAVPPIRVAAFAKQLLTLSLHLPQKSSVAVLSLLQQVIKTHGNKIASLWNTEERRGDGVFDPLSESAESSNVFASTVWEGELLRWHFDPKVREASGGIEKMVGEVK